MKLMLAFLILFTFLSSMSSFRRDKPIDSLFDESDDSIEQDRMDDPLRKLSYTKEIIKGGSLVTHARAKTNSRKKSPRVQQIHHHKEYQLPVLRPRGGNMTTKRCKCACHKSYDYENMHNLLTNILKIKQQPENVTFEYALEHSDRYTLRLAKSRLAGLRHKLADAKEKYSWVFDTVNKSLGDVATQLETAYSKVCKKLDELEGVPLKSDEYQGHEEFLQQYQSNLKESDHRLHQKLYRHYMMRAN